MTWAGTKIEGVLLHSLHDASPLLRMRIDTEGTKGYDHVILAQIQKLVSLMQEQSGQHPQRIGFGTHGVLDPVLQTMKNCNSTSP